MGNIRTYTPDQQRRIIRRYSMQGTMRVACLMVRKQHDVIAMCEERAMGLGLAEYGDSTFHMARPSIELGTMEELADAAFYQTIYSAIEAGAIPEGTVPVIA